jgi:acetyl-CoA C-acetyltransferase
MKHAFLRAAVVRRGWRDRTRNLMELIFDATSEALAQSNLPFDAIDSTVLAAHDLVDGRSLSSMVTAPAAGSYLRDETRVSDDGATALAIAAARVRAGLSRNCLVVAWGRGSEGQADLIANALFDPFFSRPLGMTELAVSAMRASSALRVFPSYAEGRTAASARRPGSPDRRPPPVAPLRPDEHAAPGDLVAATVVTEAETDVRIIGTGMSSEPYWIGDRDLLALPALQQAAARALSSAGRRIDEMAVLELDGLTLFDEALAVEAVGAAARGGGMAALVSDERVNRSGGYAGGYCAPAMGLVRTAEAVALARTAGRPALALASGSSTVAAQTQTVVLLEAA